MRTDKFRAYKLRMSGKSYTEISRYLKVPKSTLSTWFSGLEIPPEAQKRLKDRVYEKSIRGLLKRNLAQTELAQKRAQSTRDIASKEVGSLSKRDLFIAGIALYWTEGYKRLKFKNGRALTNHPVSFTNSDSRLISLFIKFLREICHVENNKISLGLRYFEHQDPAYLLDFWQKVARIPLDRFQKVLQIPSISSQRKKTFNRPHHGVVQIRVNSTALYHKIMGWIEGLN